MNFLCPLPGSVRAAKKCISVLIACLWLLLHHFETARETIRMLST